MLPQYYMDSDVISMFKSSTTHGAPTDTFATDGTPVPSLVEGHIMSIKYKKKYDFEVQS